MKEKAVVKRCPLATLGEQSWGGGRQQQERHLRACSTQAWPVPLDLQRRATALPVAQLSAGSLGLTCGSFI